MESRPTTKSILTGLRHGSSAPCWDLFPLLYFPALVTPKSWLLSLQLKDAWTLTNIVSGKMRSQMRGCLALKPQLSTRHCSNATLPCSKAVTSLCEFELDKFESVQYKVLLEIRLHAKIKYTELTFYKIPTAAKYQNWLTDSIVRSFCAINTGASDFGWQNT